MTRFGSVSDVRTVSSIKPTCCRRIGRTFSLIAFAVSWDFPGLLLTSTTRVNMGNSPFVGYGLKGTSREMRDAGCPPISGQKITLLPSNEHRQGRKECNRKICEVNQIGVNHSAGGGSQTQRISFKEGKTNPCTLH